MDYSVAGTIKGEVNSSELAGTCGFSYVSDANTVYGFLDFSKRAEGFDELSASCTSIQSSIGSMFSLPQMGCLNLHSILGDEFEVDVTFNTFCATDTWSALSPVGAVTQKLKAKKEKKNTFRCDITLGGQYQGPEDIYWSPGYSVHMRQLEAGMIEGVYGQPILTKSGTTIYCLSRRLYRYDTAIVLPFDEILTYRIMRVQKELRKDGGAHMPFVSQAYYVPAEPARLGETEIDRDLHISMQQHSESMEMKLGE